MEQEDVTLYRTLEIDVTTQDVLSLTEKDIASAYRKAALKWHPDKNPGNSKAADKFSKLFLAYETLSNPSKRKQYDDRIRQVRARRRAHQQMDVTRRKMREQLHEREIQAAKLDERHHQQHQRQHHYQDDSAISRVQREIERLRKDAILKEQRERERQQKTKAMQQPLRTEPVAKDDDFGIWASVPGFNQFRAAQPQVPFDEFEEAILNGQDPFRNQ